MSLGLFLYVRTNPSSILPIFGLVLLFGVCRAFASPASRALPIDLAPPEVLNRVIALRTVSSMTGAIAGPVALGFVFVGGRALPYLVAATGFLSAIAMMTLVSPPAVRQHRPIGARKVIRDAFEGLRFIRRTPIVFGAITCLLYTSDAADEL